jgi:hypothetical protein
MDPRHSLKNEKIGKIRDILKYQVLRFKGSSKNVIPAKAGIQNPWTSLDSGVRRSDEMIILRGFHKV